MRPSQIIFLSELSVKNRSSKENVIFIWLNGNGKKFITKICAVTISEMVIKNRSVRQSKRIQNLVRNQNADNSKLGEVNGGGQDSLLKWLVGLVFSYRHFAD